MEAVTPTNNDQIGVNLGGWLVLEKWMTPSVFDGLSAKNEYEMSQDQKGRQRILEHRKTFITDADIAWLAAAKVKLVRLPIGYWAFEDKPPYISCREQLDWLMNAAQQHGIKVLIDLHAAPGAQNASDHSGSGQPGAVNWYKRANRMATTEFLMQLARTYGNHPALWGIELLNEPLVNFFWRKWQLLGWTKDTIKALRTVLPANVRIVVSDCYNPSYWSGKILGETLDIHHYQCFDKKDVAATSYNYHLDKLAKSASAYRGYAQKQPIIIGEWSAVLPPNTSSPDNEAAFLRAQLAAQTGARASFFWNYKTEHDGGWNFVYNHKQGF